VLSSFDPKRASDDDAFVDLGRLYCLSEPYAEPFSMAVDRNAVAWIIYDSAELFTVDLREDPLRCRRMKYDPESATARFGMGFASDSSGASTESLYVTASPLGGSLNTTKFGTLTVSEPQTVKVQSTLAGAPELTGSGSGRLWAFFPNVSTPYVAELNKADGSVLEKFDAAELGGTPHAWAFAFWGGDFYVFLERATDPATQIWRMNARSGQLKLLKANTRRRIVGAGVSTCAPASP
jgi:hypothetical protein